MYIVRRNKISLPTFLLNFLKRLPPTCLCSPTCLLNFAKFSFLHVYSNLLVYWNLQIFPSYMFIPPYTFIRNSRVCRWESCHFFLLSISDPFFTRKKGFLQKIVSSWSLHNTYSKYIEICKNMKYWTHRTNANRITIWK